MFPCLCSTKTAVATFAVVSQAAFCPRRFAGPRHRPAPQRRQTLEQELLPASDAPGPAHSASDARQARAPSVATVRIYGAAWVAFQTWCRAQDAECLPAAPRTVAAYLDACGARLGPSGLRRILAALAYRHRSAGQPWHGNDPLVARTLAGLKAHATRPRRAATFADTELQRLVATCDLPEEAGGGLAACRDRALLLAIFSAGLRRSELVALDHGDVRHTAQGMILHLWVRARAGGAAEVVVARGPAPLCAVRAMEAWLGRAGIEYGPAFPRITAAGTLEDRLTGNGVWRILRRRAALAGLNGPAGERVSPQALRRSFQARTA